MIMILKAIGLAGLACITGFAQTPDFSEIRLVGASGYGLRIMRPDKGKAKIVGEFVANELGASIGGSVGYAAYDWESGVVFMVAPPFGSPRWVHWIDRSRPDEQRRVLIPELPEKQAMDMYLTRSGADSKLLLVRYVHLPVKGDGTPSESELRPILRIDANGASAVDPLKETRPKSSLSLLSTFGDLGGYSGDAYWHQVYGGMREGRFVAIGGVAIEALALVSPQPVGDWFRLNISDKRAIAMESADGRVIYDLATKTRRPLKGLEGLMAQPLRSYGNWLGAALHDWIDADKGDEPADPLEAIQKHLGLKARKQLWLYEIATGIDTIIPVSHRDSEVLLVTPDGRVVFREDDRVYGAKIVGPTIQHKTLLCQDPWIPFVHWAIEGKPPAKQ